MMSRKGIVFYLSIWLCLLVSATGLADWLPGEDVLGIYSAPDGTGFISAGGNGYVSVYLVATGVSQPSGMARWECSISWTDHPGAVFYLGFELLGDAVNVSQVEGDFNVELAQPLLPMPDGSIALATINFMIFGAVVEVYLHPAHASSDPGYMVFAQGDDPEILHRFSWSQYDERCPVFYFNGITWDCFIPTARISWGAVKALYE